VSTPLIAVVPPSALDVPDPLRATIPAVQLRPDLASVLPAPLASQARWTAWDLVPHKNRGGKPAKVPRSRTNDSTTWKSLTDAISAAKGHAGVGFQMLGAHHSVGIDIDHCIDATGTFNDLATRILQALPDTYAEVTPSGTGLRIFCSRAKGQDVPEFLNRDAGLECYVGKSARYLTVTGAVLPGRAGKYTPVTDAAVQLLARHVTNAGPRKAEALTLPPPDKLPPAEWEDLLALTGAQGEELTLIEEGLPPGDRSEMVMRLVCRMLDAGLELAVVYRFLITSPGIWEYALSKRQDNPGRAQALLWAEVRKGLRKTGAAPDDSPKSPFVARMEKLNERYFVADEKGKILVCTLEPDEDHNGREVLVRYTFKAFCDKFQREQFEIPVKGRSTRTGYLGNEWLRYDQRRQYGRITFNPRGDSPPEVFNLWRGWAVEPAAGDWSVIRAHIEQVVCSDSPDLIRYVMGWLAFLVQRPWERPGTALILRGKEGAGKSMFGDAVRHLVGSHSMAVSNAKHLVGNFNQHLRNCLVLQADEAIFAGNHEHASILKALITDPDLIIEGKGIDALLSKNYIHLIMTSNEEWVVPAGLEARRFVVLDVSEAHRGDFKYFAALQAATKDDRVAAAMLYDLQRWPLAGFEVRTVPDTAGLRDQKMRSLSGINGWLVDLLTTGELQSEFGAGAWRPFFTSRELRKAYQAWIAAHRRGERVLSDMTFGKEMNRLFPWYRRAPARDVTTDKDSPGYRFGTLDEARERFCDRAGLAPSIFDNCGSENEFDIFS
jgi:Family of unknown function (DUF5906)